jgi:predicted flap endonuclease-1-like 5' DNA nuclease
MSRQTQNSMALVGIIAGGVGLVAFILLLLFGGFGFSAAFFIALLLAAAVAIFLLFALHGPAGSSTGATSSSDASAASVKTSVPPAPASDSEPETAPASEEAPVQKAEPVDAPEEAPAPEPAPEPEPEPQQAAASDAANSQSSGSRPAGLDGPRDGGADDLKRIKGVGPKLEALLNRLGFWHFDQVAAWTSDEIAWVDQNLEGFNGRVTRDAWVEQARILAQGGETEFSKRVDDGDMY